MSLPGYTPVRQITQLELRDGVELIVSAPVPMTPEGLTQLAAIVQRLKVSMRHYLKKKAAVAPEQGQEA